MPLVTDYGLENPSRRLSLLLLSLPDSKGTKEMDGIHLHKIVRYYEYLAQKSDIEFSNYKLGAVSYELVENLEVLEETGLVDENQGRLSLSHEGEKATKELWETTRKEDIQKLGFAKKQLNDLSGDELMFFMYNLLPESRQNSTEWGRLERKKSELVKALFRKGKISSLVASEWIGKSEREFLASVPTSKG